MAPQKPTSGKFQKATLREPLVPNRWRCTDGSARKNAASAYIMLTSTSWGRLASPPLDLTLSATNRSVANATQSALSLHPPWHYAHWPYAHLGTTCATDDGVATPTTSTTIAQWL